MGTSQGPSGCSSSEIVGCRQFSCQRNNHFKGYCVQARTVSRMAKGECPDYYFVKARGGDRNLNYQYPGQELFSALMAPCIKFIAAELYDKSPPSHIMTRVHNRDISASGKTRIGRNRLGPRGNGLKFKRCCG